MEALESAAGILNCGEVFHPEGMYESELSKALRLKPLLNFFAFRAEHQELKNQPPFFAPDQARAFDEYIAFVRAKSACGDIALNIKANSWHHFDSVWQGLTSRPRMMDLLDHHAATYVIVERRDLLAQVLSEFRAQTTNVWHLASDGIQPRNLIEVDVPRILRRAREITQDTTQLLAWLPKRTARHIFYEDALVDGRLSRATIECVRSLGDFSFSECSAFVRLAQMRDSNYKWVRNPKAVAEEFASAFPDRRDAALAALSNTEYEHASS